ncbi:hypothetical protein G9A89_013609 [Geosiphon pyriformis]|nr:hypothetical protein G9A89_013609 [Geosiphon pyriformis]
MVAGIEHCVYCFDVLVANFEGRDHAQPNFEDDHYPLFVTWNIINHGNTRLRGCIGNFEALPLHSGLKEYAITSAFHDRRFSPITIRELATLQCSVSLLTNFEDATDYLDWELGVHGIWIEFQDENNRRKTATYLPEVAEDQGWTKVEAIDSLLRKSGFTGRITDRVRQRIILTRYQSAKHGITYDEYLKYTVQNGSKATTEKSAKIKDGKKKKKRLSKTEPILGDGFDIDEIY